MKMSSAIRVALLALTAFAGTVLSSASNADEGSVVPADDLHSGMDHWRLGRRRRVELPRQEIRALNRRTGLLPRVRRIEDSAAWPGQHTIGRRTSPVSTVAAGAGLAVGGGARAIVLTNQKGAVLELSGRQVGLMANADPHAGWAITLK